MLDGQSRVYKRLTRRHPAARVTELTSPAWVEREVQKDSNNCNTPARTETRHLTKGQSRQCDHAKCRKSRATNVDSTTSGQLEQPHQRHGDGRTTASPGFRKEFGNVSILKPDTATMKVSVGNSTLASGNWQSASLTFSRKLASSWLSKLDFDSALGSFTVKNVTVYWALASALSPHLCWEPPGCW